LSEAKDPERFKYAVAPMVHPKKAHVIDDRGLLDPAAVLTLNNIHAKETSTLTAASLAELLDMSFYARGIDRGTTAFLIALDQNAPTGIRTSVGSRSLASRSSTLIAS